MNEVSYRCFEVVETSGELYLYILQVGIIVI